MSKETPDQSWVRVVTINYLDGQFDYHELRDFRIEDSSLILLSHRDFCIPDPDIVRIINLRAVKDVCINYVYPEAYTAWLDAMAKKKGRSND